MWLSSYVNANIYVANAWRVGANWLISTCSNINYKPVSKIAQEVPMNIQLIVKVKTCI